MTHRRWIADEVSGNHAALTGAHAEHLVRVLRARVGQEFDIATGSVVRRGRVTSLADHRIEFELGEEVPAAKTANVTLLLAVFKFDRMEWAIEKCTELGVSRIVPVIARRTDAHLVSAAMKRVERWRRIALHAAEQSRRSVPPEIVAPMKLKDATGLPGELRIVLAESETQTHLRGVLASHPVGVKTLLAVGPEGGWAEDELQIFEEAGWLSASLGSTVLRAETAAIAATVITTSEVA
ncbi:Ribosomal RNA small subunit methyltransferase E [Candidatus Sulfotelmatobacter kueseliae]|uniref:Ribosomal RNA small subunit methyltransferase E n=1 Tax=Candidatus Sulfotelmatobacter kueseliae TaxID=2042962 RepID=A0A2U3KNS1_9BACT|nr:Ribosomal RNA small subunit methyltransferase E [Candidatus Sulfotelmatobacter kueseliae]